jgi:hypothetical protein
MMMNIEPFKTFWWKRQTWETLFREAEEYAKFAGVLAVEEREADLA